MAFVIEDADDDDDEQQYDFQAKWNQPTKSFFGGQGNDGNDGDEYNFDFGKPAASRKKSSSPPSQWRADPSVRSSLPASTAAGGKAGSSNANNSAVRNSAPVNIMDKAQNMLQKYANPSTAAPQRRSQNLALNFDEDDLSVGSDSEDNHRAAALGHSSKYDMSFSPMANAEWAKSHKGGFGPSNKGAKDNPMGGSHGSSRSADLPELNFSPSVRSDNTMVKGLQTGGQFKSSSLSSEPTRGQGQGRGGYGSGLKKHSSPEVDDDEDEEGLDVGSDAGQATSIGDDEDEDEEEGDETFEESHDRHNESNSSSDSGSSESEVGLSRAESHHQPLHQFRAAASASASATATAPRRRLQSDESDGDDEDEDDSGRYHEETAASEVDDVDEDDAPRRRFNVMTFDALNDVAGWDTSVADATGAQDTAAEAEVEEESSSSVQEVDESHTQSSSRLQADVSASMGDASYEVPVSAAVKVAPTATSKPKPAPATAVVAQPKPVPAATEGGAGGAILPMPSVGDEDDEEEDVSLLSEQVVGTIAQKAALQQKQLWEAQQRRDSVKKAPPAAPVVTAPAAVVPAVEPQPTLAPPTVSTSAAFAPSTHLAPAPELSTTPPYAPQQQQQQPQPQQQYPQAHQQPPQQYQQQHPQPHGYPQQAIPPQPQGPPTAPYGYGYPPVQVNGSWQPQQHPAVSYGQPPPSTYGGFGASRGLYSSTTSAYDPMVMQLLHELHQAKLEAAEANNRLAEVLLQLHKNTELTRSSVASMPTSGGRSGASSRTASPRRRSNSDASRYGRSNSSGKKSSGGDYEDDYEDEVPDEAANSDNDDYEDDYEDDFEESRITNASASSIVVDSDSDEDVGPRGAYNRGKTSASAPKKVVMALPKASSASAQAKKTPSSQRGSNNNSSSNGKSSKTVSRSAGSPAKTRSEAGRRSVTIADDPTGAGASATAKSLSDREFLSKLMESAAGRDSGSGDAGGLGSGRGLEGVAPLRSVSAAASTAEDPLGSALLASQALFRKQLGSLRQRLQVANSCYYDAMLRSSGAGTGIGPISAPATGTGTGMGTGSFGAAGSSSSSAPATASTEPGAGAELRFSQGSHPAGPGGVPSLQQLMDQFSHNREAQQKQLYAQMQSGAYYSPHVSMPFQQQPPVIQRGLV